MIEANIGEMIAQITNILEVLILRWDSPSPSELSEAGKIYPEMNKLRFLYSGFYFIGPRDNVQCFSCDTCQNYWKPAEVRKSLQSSTV